MDITCCVSSSFTGALMVPGLPTILDQSTSSDNHTIHTSTSSKQSNSLVRQQSMNTENMNIDKSSPPPPLHPRKQQNVDVKKTHTPRHQISVPATLPLRAQIVSLFI